MPRPTAVLTTRGQSFLASGVVLLGAGLLLGLGDLVRLGLLLVVLAVGAWLLGRRPARWVRVERTVVPPRLVVGQPGEVTLVVRNGGRWRSPLVLAQEHLSYALGDRPRMVVSDLRPGETQSAGYPVQSLVRGEHPLGPLSVQVQDPFGLTNRLTRCPEVSSVLVVPEVLPLSGAVVPGSGPGQDEDVADTVALHGEDDVTIRPYRQGDELRRIHWPASAHTGDLMVRQEEQPSRRRAVVLLDRRPTAHAGEGPLGSFEWAVTAAASVVAHLLDHDYDVDLVTELPHDGERPAGLDAALDQLARTTLGDPTQLGAAARAASRQSAGLVVAVLGSASMQGVEELAGARRPGTTAVALVADAPSFASASQTAARGRAQDVVDHLRGRGWRAVVGTPSLPLAQAWQAATSDARPVR